MTKSVKFKMTKSGKLKMTKSEKFNIIKSRNFKMTNGLPQALTEQWTWMSVAL